MDGNAVLKTGVKISVHADIFLHVDRSEQFLEILAGRINRPLSELGLQVVTSYDLIAGRATKGRHIAPIDLDDIPLIAAFRADGRKCDGYCVFHADFSKVDV